MSATQAPMGYGPRPSEQLEDAPTIEFAPGLRRPISLGTPPPPPTSLFEARLGSLAGRPGARRLRVLVPVLAAGMVFAAIGIGLGLRTPAPVQSTGAFSRATDLGTLMTNSAEPTPTASDAASPSPEPTATPTQAAPNRQAAPVTQPTAATTTTSSPPPPPTPPVEPTGPTLAAPAPVTLGQIVFLNGYGFPCGAGGQIVVTISKDGTEVPIANAATDTDAQGATKITIHTDTIVTVGEWTVKASNAVQAACTAASSATAKVTITAG